MKSSTLHSLNVICDAMVQVAQSVREDGIEAIASNDPVTVIRHFAHLRTATKKIKEAREALAEMEDRLSREQVPDVMRAHGIKTTTIEGVGRVSLSSRWSCSMLDKPLGLDWLRNEGHGGLIQETVNAQTLASFAKDLFETKGIELPVDIFKTGTMTFTSITKV